MKKETFTQLLAIVDAGAKIAQMMPHPNTAGMGTFLGDKLAQHMVEIFPDSKTFAEQAQRRFQSAAVAHAGGTIPQSAVSRPMAEAGPALWEVLHRRAFTRPADFAQELIWLLTTYRDRLFAELSCSACGVNFLRYVQENPPDFERYFEWTVDLHNHVNGKKAAAALKQNPEAAPAVVLTVAEARARWE